jgi:DNA helicase-2/ATP-dependent DNA helicase PcrA
MVGVGRVDSRAPSIDVRRSATPTPSGPTLRVGQSVFHTKFGEGVILTIEGQGDHSRAQINFGRHGAKWLDLSVAAAKLTPV